MGKHLDLGFQILGIDLDDTLFTNEFPEVGEPNLLLIEKVKEFQQAGNKVILWTCRTGEALQIAVNACAKYGLFFDCVNDDLPEVKSSEFGQNKSAKIHVNLLVDDKAPSSIDDFLSMDFSMPQEEIRFDLIDKILK